MNAKTSSNDGGEKWVIANCWQSETSFPLLRAMRSARYLGPGRERTQVYAARDAEGIDTERLTHFAAGIFWRAAAREWSAKAGHSPIRLRLGPYEEALRLFLTGKKSFPEDIALLLFVIDSMDVINGKTVILPWLRDKKEWREYRFRIPGVIFHMLVGRAVPRPPRRNCFAKSKENVIRLAPADFALHDMRAVARVTVKGKLAKE